MSKSMRAVVYRERGTFVLEERPVPQIQAATDAIVRVTLASICTAHYGSAGYAELVAGFNGLQTDSELDPGSILLLPLRDQLAQYMEN